MNQVAERYNPLMDEAPRKFGHFHIEIATSEGSLGVSCHSLRSDFMTTYNRCLQMQAEGKDVIFEAFKLRSDAYDCR